MGGNVADEVVVMRPKLVAGKFPMARYNFLANFYTHVSWYGIGIGNLFIGINWFHDEEGEHMAKRRRLNRR